MKFKIILFYSLYLLTAHGYSANDADKHIAKFFLSDPDSFLNKNIELNVSYFDPLKCKYNVDDVVWFMAHTEIQSVGNFGRWSSWWGGNIPIAVDAKKASEFIDMYGLSPKRRNDGYLTINKLNGKLEIFDEKISIHSGYYFLDCTTMGQFSDKKDKNSILNTIQYPADYNRLSLTDKKKWVYDYLCAHGMKMPEAKAKTEIMLGK